MALVVVAALCLAGALVLFLAYPAQAQGDGEPPARPTGLEASEAAGGGVDLAWDDPEDDSITGYEILRRDRAEHAVGVFETIEADTGSKEAAYTDATAQAGGSYVYRVKAINTHGVSEWSSYDRIELPAEADDPEPDPTPTPTPTPDPEATPEDLAPTGLEVNLVENRVTLTWEAPAEDADSVTGYEVLRAQGDAELTTLVADTESAATGYVDATANEPGVRYTYRVKALRGSDVSQWSNFAFIDLDQDYTPPEPEPASEPDPASLAPSNLTAGIVDDGVSLSWDAPAQEAESVTGYEILRAQGESELTTLVADTESTATSYTDTTATEPGETYAYRVKAIRDEEKSQGSNQAEVLIPHTPEDLAPANLTAGIVDDGVALIWDAPAQDAESVTGYEVSSEWTAAGGDMPHALKALIDSVATAWTDRTDKEAGVRYTYRVRAVRDGERSGWSNAAHVDLPGKESRNPKDEPPVALPQVVNESELWSTTMTVGYFDDGVFRGYTGSGFPTSYGSIADDDFVYDGTTYTVFGLAQQRTNDTLSLHLDKSLPTSGLFLGLGGVFLSLSGASESTNTLGRTTIYSYGWSGTNMTFTWADGEAVSVSIEEIPPGVTVSPTELTLQEGSSGNYTVVLDSEPTGDVTITIGGHANTDVSVSPATLTFTSGTWDTAQTVTVTAAADADAVDDPTITLTHTGSGATEYTDVKGGEVDVTITETDTVGVTISPTELTLVEGESRPYSVVLDTQPTANVTVRAYVAVLTGTPVATDVSMSPSSGVTFTPGNWNLPQEITVTARQDDDAVADAPATLIHSVLGAAEYNGLDTENVVVTITEDDTAGVTVSKMALTLVEGESGGYTLELTSEPTATVTVTLGGHAGTDVSVSPASLTFNAANWNTARTVTVTADHDPDTADDAAVTLSHAVSGTGEYAGITAATVTVNITDDDSVVSLTADAASVVEGVAATFTLTRTGYLAQARTVNVALTETGGWGYIQDPAPTARFAANANATTLTVNTNDDKVVGNSGSVTAALAPGASYVAAPPESATVNMTDNDTAGDVAWDLMVSPDTITEGDAGTTVTLSITNGYTFTQLQTVRLFWLGLDVDSLSLLEGQEGTGAITIAAGASSGSLVLIGSDDDVYNTGEGQIISPLEAQLEGTQIGNPVDLTWVDDEPPPMVTLTASENDIFEGDTITLTATTSPRLGGRHGIDITYTDSGGVVTGTVPTILRFSGGQSEQDLTIATDDDLVDEPNAEVTFTLSNPEYPVTLGTPSSVTVRVRDDDVKPSAPVSLDAEAGDDTADLTWTTGNAGSRPITKYRYRVSGDAGQNWNPGWTDIPGSGPSTVGYTVTGLRNDNSYAFEVRAVNVVGAGAVERAYASAFSTLLPDTHNWVNSPRKLTRSVHRSFGRPWTIEEEYLDWFSPEGVAYYPYTTYDFFDRYEGNGFSAYEVQRRTRPKSGGWGAWADIEDLESKLGRTTWHTTKLVIEGAEACENKEWRVRAIYEKRSPAYHSEWVTTGSYNRKPPRAPWAPDPDRESSWLRKTGDNAYSLSFRWFVPNVQCWPVDLHEVERREYLGSYYGTPLENPPEGEKLWNPNRDVYWDSATMTITGNHVWTNWESVTIYAFRDGISPPHTESFTGNTNYQFRVRAGNDVDWGSWSKPMLFGLSLTATNGFGVYLED